MMVDEKNAEQTEIADSGLNIDTESPTFAAVEAKMAELRGDVEKNDDDSQSVDDEQGDESESEDKSDSEQTDDDSGDLEKKEDDSFVLPAGHRRAALARGYTNEDVDQYLKIKPDEAVERFGEIFDEWQRENSRWSNRGRQLSDTDRNVLNTEEPDASVTKVSEGLPHFDVEALVKEHGNEDLINALVSPMNAMIDRVNVATDKISASENFLRSTEENTLIRTTQEFLGSKEMESYRDTYGTKIEDLTDVQAESRMKLFGQADMLIAGARDQGTDLTVTESLERAHAIMSQGSRDEAIRREIRKSLEKRTKTIKSSHQQTSTLDAGQEVSEDELERRTEARLQKIRNK